MSYAEWTGLRNMPARKYTCAYVDCGSLVSSEYGLGEGDDYWTARGDHYIYICPNCGHPTYFAHDEQIPGPPFGDKVTALPPDVEGLYNEARACMTISVHTAAVMACRKLLMNIAVSQGADENLKYFQYVDYLSDKGFAPPGGKAWVDRIRDKGNDANHEIPVMSRGDAEELITFLEMLLKFIYEFPSKAASKSGKAKS